MILTSMTEFVLAEKNSTPVVRNFTGFMEKSHYEKLSYSRIVKYAEFLKQPLKLEMFVPFRLTFKRLCVSAVIELLTIN